MTAIMRTILYVCCMVIALMCWLAALTIVVAIATNRLPDSQAWTAVVFFAIMGGFAWIGGRTAKRDLSSDWINDE